MLYTQSELCVSGLIKILVLFLIYIKDFFFAGLGEILELALASNCYAKLCTLNNFFTCVTNSSTNMALDFKANIKILHVYYEKDV